MRASQIWSSACLTALMVLTTQASAQTDAANPYYSAAQTELSRKLAVQPNTSKARNIIIFVGDGMGVSTTTAARILAGQEAGKDGEAYVMTMDALPFSGLVKTYSHDSQVADSAPTATALMSGVKSRNSIIGLSHEAEVGNCASAQTTRVASLIELAEDAGLATGVVTTTRITHATPASAYAHTPERDWEDDVELSKAVRAEACVDIARQLIEFNHGDGLEVVLGGGRRHFLPQTVADPEYADKKGRRKDGRNLIADWQKAHPKGQYVWDAKGFKGLDLTAKGPILGLFEPDHMQYEVDRARDKAGEPSLAEMTALAITRLKSNPKGFVLLVEGGRIDHAHHAGQAGRALHDTVALDKALRTAQEMTDSRDTLIIVTADHSHGLTMSGYPARGNPILGLAKDSEGKVIKAADGKPYTTLTYATGPGAEINKPRGDISAVNTEDPDYHQQALLPAPSAAHSGEDVAVRASGPFAHLLQGTIEQNLIFHVMRHAAQIPAP
ncbi:alkaline phosphatase [Asticcacaulis machinosus]|uniref:Alkaline phosphatase n=1 Tax=Asticcacaulis machinosus TaxID=2984211 RepID=A0ABT5HHM5_9CAUL|nr:alkaline phosphatase [Asticcacaulis machinosus]MDC7675754.1 alkaline phosphatase [Asticcacaulis machinosus]